MAAVCELPVHILPILKLMMTSTVSWNITFFSDTTTTISNKMYPINREFLNSVMLEPAHTGKLTGRMLITAFRMQNHLTGR
jgi:hypothetical protein